MSLKSFQDKDICSMIMTLDQCVRINKIMRRDNILDYLREKINKHILTDDEVSQYCKNCSHIGFIFTGSIERQTKKGNYYYTHVVVSSIFYRKKYNLTSGPVIRSDDLHYDRDLRDIYVSNVDFSNMKLPTPFHIRKKLGSYRKSCYIIEDRIMYDLFTIYNILISLYWKYIIEYPHLEIIIDEIIQKKVKDEILKSEYEHERSVIIQVSREILEMKTNVPDSIMSLFDWIDGSACLKDSSACLNDGLI